MKYGKINNFLEGKEVETATNQKVDIINPATEEKIGEVVMSSKEDLYSAIPKIKEAQKEWANLSSKKRAEIIFNYRALLIEHKEELAEVISDENGKLKIESYAGIDKAIELSEFACSIPSVINQEVQEVSRGVEVKEKRVPVGIVASITPFNFPMMVPNWTITNALVLGNAVIVKDSALTPITCMKIAKLMKLAGIPDGVFNVMHGEKEIVEALCDHEEIDAVTFVGSTPVAKIVYARATSNLKRCLALGGAKNHIIVTPEVDAKNTASEIIAAATGMSGQRCMAASVIITVGNCDHIISLIKEELELKKIGVDMPPLVSKISKEKLFEYLENTTGEVLVDGRKFDFPEKGYYVGPSLIKYDRPSNMSCDEIFAPTLEVIQVNTIEEAVGVQKQSPYANGASIYTTQGYASAYAIDNLTSGMLGVNIGVPVPREPYGFGGLKSSKFGYGDITGKDSINFFTNKKKITTKWNYQDKDGWMS